MLLCSNDPTSWRSTYLTYLYNSIHIWHISCILSDIVTLCSGSAGPSRRAQRTEPQVRRAAVWICIRLELPNDVRCMSLGSLDRIWLTCNYPAWSRRTNWSFVALSCKFVFCKTWGEHLFLCSGRYWILQRRCLWQMQCMEATLNSKSPSMF